MTCHARFPVGDPKALLFDIKEAPAGSPSWAGRWDAHLIDRCHHPEHVARFDREVFPDPRTGRWERSQARVARVYCQTIVTFVPSKRSAAVVGTPASTGTRLPPCRRVRTIGPGAGKFGGPRPRHRQRLLHRRYHPEHVAAGDGEVARAEGGGGRRDSPSTPVSISAFRRRALPYLARLEAPRIDPVRRRTKQSSEPRRAPADRCRAQGSLRFSPRRPTDAGVDRVAYTMRRAGTVESRDDDGNQRAVASA